jgi:hypothetical protein
MELVLLEINGEWATLGFGRVWWRSKIGPYINLIFSNSPFP